MQHACDNATSRDVRPAADRLLPLIPAAAKDAHGTQIDKPLLLDVVSRLSNSMPLAQECGRYRA